MAAGLLAAMMFATDAPAQTPKGVLYDCDMKQTRRNETWVSNKIGIVLLNDGKVVVSDRMILGYQLSTVTAALLRNTDREIRVAWRLEGGMRESEQGVFILPDAEYSAVISKPSNRIVVRGKLPGYSKTFSGRGTCTTRVE